MLLLCLLLDLHLLLVLMLLDLLCCQRWWGRRRELLELELTWGHAFLLLLMLLMLLDSRWVLLGHVHRVLLCRRDIP